MRNPFRRVQKRTIDDAVAAYGKALAAGGRGALTIVNTSAAAIAAREFGSALASTRSNHPALGPGLLNNVGRDLCLRGHSLLLVDVQDGIVSLQRPTSWDVSGNSPDPSRWRYECQVAGPTQTTDVIRLGSSVAHLRYASNAATPWRGISPLESDASFALANLETKMRAELNSPTGYLLPVPDTPQEDGDDEIDDSMQELADQLTELDGGIHIVESMGQGWQEGRGATPSGEWVPRRFGAVLPDSLIKAHRQLVEMTLSAAGVPPILAAASVDNSAIREGRRSFLSSTVVPLVAILEEALSVALETPIEMSLEHLLQGDLTARSRAVGSLVQAGVSTAQALRLAGFTDDGESA